MTISFNKELYSLKAIQIAVRAYKDLASFSISKNKRYFVVALNKIHKDIEPHIKDEFCNYVLAEIRS